MGEEEEYLWEKIYISLSKHKTTDNLELKKAFTVGFATKKTEEISDYFGVVSGNKEDKIAKSGVHVVKFNFVDAPIIEEYPLTLECTVDSFEDGELIGSVVNSSVDEEYLDENGNIDVDKMEIITFDYDTMKELDCWKTCQEIQMEVVIMMKLLAKE